MDAKERHKRLDLIRHRTSQEVKNQIDETIQAIDRAYYLGISDFKASLREAIEKEKVSRGISGHYADGRTWAFEKVLELLDTVPPQNTNS